MVETKCQPIAILKRNSIFDKSLGRRKTYHQNYDIASDDVLTYKEMLQRICRSSKTEKVGYIPFLL